MISSDVPADNAANILLSGSQFHGKYLSPVNHEALLESFNYETQLHYFYTQPDKTKYIERQFE